MNEKQHVTVLCMLNIANTSIAYYGSLPQAYILCSGNGRARASPPGPASLSPVATPQHAVPGYLAGGNTTRRCEQRPDFTLRPCSAVQRCSTGATPEAHCFYSASPPSTFST